MAQKNSAIQKDNMFEDFEIEMIKSPTEEDWAWCKTCTLNTIGKKVIGSIPTDEWKRKIIAAEHSPLRELWFGFRMTIPSWVVTHFVRHHIGVNHYVQSQRNDRQNNYDRNEAPQGTKVSYIMSINAQELVFMAHKRLCNQASPETRYVMQQICHLVIEKYPEFKEVLVPLCEYRNGKCTEFFPCGRFDNKQK